MSTDPTPTLAYLEERVRAGDTTITAQDLAQAREAEHLAGLRREADERAQTAADEAAHAAAVEKLREDHAKLQDGQSAAARKAYAELVRASAKLIDELAKFEPKRRSVSDRAMDLGVPIQCDEAARIPAQPTSAYLKHAIDEASGKYWATGNGAAPHALHSDDVVAEYEVRRQEALDAQAAREAAAAGRTETMVELGYGKYARRVDA